MLQCLLAHSNDLWFWSGEANHCTVPDYTSVQVTVTKPVEVSVVDTDGVAFEGLKVYAFDGSTYTGFSGTTDASGEVSFRLPAGDYRFRSDRNGTQFWSGDVNHCTLPGCEAASITVSKPVSVAVQDTDGAAQGGLKVYAFDGTTYTGFNGITDSAGIVAFTLPLGDYRFRVDLNGTQFWSGEANNCTIPGCESISVVVTKPVTVTVQDTDTVPSEGVKVYAFDGSEYTGFQGTTDASGAVTFTLPQGDYRFRADLNGTQFWSGEVNHCSIPGCESAGLTVTKPVLVTIASELGDPYADLPVYVFDGETYTGFSGTSDTNGQVSFTLPIGDYRFRSDFDGAQFWSNSLNHCTVPGCEAATVEIPGGFGNTTTTINYDYDPLYRLTAADYSSGEYFHYTYDAVGNRLTVDTHEETNTYTYDIANRLTSVNGVSYTWDDNGNLLDDGASTYSYDHANRLKGVTQGSDAYSFAYNGMGDRVRQTINSDPTEYTLDINRGLTQVLSDGDNAYLYGRNRIGEEQPLGWQYHLPDALGSVRQLTDQLGTPTRIQSFEPFGASLSSVGTASSMYAFTGEWTDKTRLIYLRARYLSPKQGRFISGDPWDGDPFKPQSLNSWSYVVNNPVTLTDPSGRCLDIDADGNCDYTVGAPVVEPYLPTVCHQIRANGLLDGCILGCSNALDISPRWEWEGKYNLSGYYITSESQYHGGISVPIPANRVGEYLGRGAEPFVSNPASAQTANERFLYHHASICQQGTGRLAGGKYISCTTPVTWWGVLPRGTRSHVGFSWTPHSFHQRWRPFKSVARSFHNNQLRSGTRIFIPELVTFLRHWDRSAFTDGILTVTDWGGGLYDPEHQQESLDLFTGEGQSGEQAALDLVTCSSPYPDSAWWDRNPEECKARPPFAALVDVYKWSPAGSGILE